MIAMEGELFIVDLLDSDQISDILGSTLVKIELNMSVFMERNDFEWIFRKMSEGKIFDFSLFEVGIAKDTSLKLHDALLSFHKCSSDRIGTGFSCSYCNIGSFFLFV